MGGGGMMRAAAKVAGITVATGGLRGVKPENFAARRAAAVRPATASPEEMKLVAGKPEIEDWVFAGGDDDFNAFVDAAPLPRVVFGGVPSIEEAREATSELTEALEKVYLSSPKSVGYEDPFVSDHDSALSLSHSQVIETTKACVTSDIVIGHAVPTPAIMAFKFLHESPVAQNVVASIACDPNVWNAVFNNEELQGFLQSQSASCSVSESCGSSSECAESEPVGDGLLDIFQKMKITVADMLSSLSGYFQNLFGGGQGESKAHVNPDGTAELSGDTVMGASFMGLAIMAILVIVLKRT